MSEYLELKTTDCKHCYKCIRNCPVKAIRFSGRQATIMQDACILCGRCFVNCPQSAQRVRDDLPKAKALTLSGAKVIASIAPSFVANYPGARIETLRDALMELGFSDASETAEGATLVKNQYDALVLEGKRSVIISTCCHTVNMLVQKYYPDALPYMAPVISPMQAHALAIRREHPDAKVVFIGPCISKKAEAEAYPGYVDCALTFEELDAWFEEKQIEVAGFPSVQEKDAHGLTRSFATGGGILHSMERANPIYDYIAVHGMSECISAMEEIVAGHVKNCFIEMSACRGSCANGPAMSKESGPIQRAGRIHEYTADKDFSVDALGESELHKRLQFDTPFTQKFGEQAIREVLRKIGKTRPEDELNCGSCGYDTCREKAAAVLAGKANLEMCLPYLMRKAQSFSDAIIRHTPNGIIVLNESLEVCQLNTAACQILNVPSEDDALGRNIVCLMEPSLFADALETGPIYDSRQYLAEYGRYVNMTVIHDADSGLIIGIMRDITGDETARAAKKELAQTTMRVTDEVISKQMRTVQEIASLLGETAAETKVALTKLKESLSDD